MDEVELERLRISTIRNAGRRQRETKKLRERVMAEAVAMRQQVNRKRINRMPKFPSPHRTSRLRGECA